MKRNTKNKFLTCLIALAIALLAAVCAIFSHTTTAQAYKTLPTGSNAIANIYKANGKFNKNKLDLLAQKVGYSGIDDMVTNVATMSTTATTGAHIKTSADFGDTVVNFGSYTFNGTTHELTWIPAFVSNTSQGPILTLWLATVGEQGTDSNQEYASFSDGTYGDEAKSYNGNTVYCGTYDSSYIRNYVLNGNTGYVTSFSGGTAIGNNRPALSSMTKFSQFMGSGALASYIVSPTNVNWQSAAAYQKNDPNWNGSGTGVKGAKANFPSDWLNDKLWLPSMHEVYDSGIAANSISTSFNLDGGMWGTSPNERTGGNYRVWLRSAGPTNLYGVFGLDGTSGFAQGGAHATNVLRPALHLNLTMAKDNAEYDHIHSFGGWTVTTPATCTIDGVKERTCSATGCDLPNSKETEVIPATGHNYGAWVDKTAATCVDDKVQERICSNANCGDKQTQTVANTKLGHLYGDLEWEWTANHSSATAKFTCTRSGCTDTRNLSATVTQSTQNATCLAAGKTTYTATLAVNGAEFQQSTYTDTQEVPIAQLNHIAETTWSKDSSKHWHVCTLNCGTKLDEVAHTFDIWKVDTPATVTSTGTGHYECICGERGADEEIPKETCSHTNKTHVAAQAATCVAAGNPEYWTCGACGKNLDSSNAEIATIVIPVDPDNHVSWGTWQTETAATCVATGTEKRTCADCNHEETRDIAIDPNAHDIEHHEAQEATCTEIGWNEYDTCKRDGCNYTTYSEIAALGHDYQAAEGGIAPTCTEPGSGKVKCTRCNDEQEGDSIPALGHDWSTEWSKDETNHWHICSRCDELNENTAHTYEWVITKEATVEESGLMENICTACGNKDGEEEIAKLIDPNGEIDLPVDINVEFKVTQSSTDNDYSDIDKGLKRGYWAQLWYRNDDGTLGDEFTDTINCFLTLKIPTEIIEAIRGGEKINRDKIAAGLKVYYIDGEGTPVEVENFAIAMRDDDSWQIKFNYNEKFRAEVVFAADLDEPVPEPETTGIPWWVWLIVGLVVVAIVGVIIVIIVVAKKKNDGNNGGDTEELKAQLAEQSEKIDELLGRDDGGFNTPVELDENGNVIFK